MSITAAILISKRYQEKAKGGEQRKDCGENPYLKVHRTFRISGLILNSFSSAVRAEAASRKVWGLRFTSLFIVLQHLANKGGCAEGNKSMLESWEITPTSCYSSYRRDLEERGSGRYYSAAVKSQKKSVKFLIMNIGGTCDLQLHVILSRYVHVI